MTSSFKINQLPTSSDLDGSDLILVRDLINETSKAVSFDSINLALSIDKLIGYDTLTTEMNDVNDSVSSIIGTFSDGQFRSLADLHNLIEQNAETETARHDSNSTLLNALDERLSNELLSNSSNIAAFIALLEEREEDQFQAGLASGFLYAKNVTVGEV